MLLFNSHLVEATMQVNLTKHRSALGACYQILCTRCGKPISMSLLIQLSIVNAHAQSPSRLWCKQDTSAVWTGALPNNTALQQNSNLPLHLALMMCRNPVWLSMLRQCSLTLIDLQVQSSCWWWPWHVALFKNIIFIRSQNLKYLLQYVRLCPKQLSLNLMYDLLI